MINTPYIEVAVTLPVDHTYTYKIPDHFKNLVDIGMRVLVPFGRRRVTGYILSGQKTDNGYQAKHILDVMDGMPLFPEAMVGFFRWISDYYVYPLGEVIKSALPSGLSRQDVTVVTLTQKGIDAGQGKLTPGEEQVIEILISDGTVTLKHLAKKISSVSIYSLIRKMEKAGWLETTARLEKEGVRVKTEKFIEYCNKPAGEKKLSQKRRQILDILSVTPGMSLSALKQKIPTAPSLIKFLAEDGFVTISERQVFRDPLGDPVDPDMPPDLTPEQAAAVAQVTRQMDRGFVPFLLCGVTGSGKTEVYMRLVADVIKKNQKAIVLVPEISLISQTERRFRARFQNRIAVIHSGLSKGERLDQWYKILNQDADVIIGARSCIFAPVENPGIIIVDEEHDGSYKQETGLKYNARDMAVVRAKLDHIPVILGSATPSVQSYFNAVNHRFKMVNLQTRINQHPLPEITVVDLKKYKEFNGIEKLITPELRSEIRACLDKQDQVLIFLNRRGFASFPVCEACGHAMTCRFCDVTLTYHKGMNVYKCHLCGLNLPVVIKCPECGSTAIKPLGFGTEKIEMLLKKLFPDARLTRMDQDTTSGKGQMVRILKSIKNRTVDIIVGTQMLAKGHDFPSITLVGIICADLSLNLPDFRACERTFQLLAQVAGRAGRGTTPGKVILQTYNPDHFSIEASKNQDVIEFFDQEITFRKALMYPPFSRIILIRMSARDARKVEHFSKNIAKILSDTIEMFPVRGDGIHIMGPIEAPIQKIASQFRWQILIKGPKASDLNFLVRQVMGYGKLNAVKDVKLAIDVDPYSLM